MNSLLNQARPPAFCPGCTHNRILTALDKAFQNMNLKGNQIVIVSDIGCSGLSDTFFLTHAFHGLHGRALNYATGIKLARPELNVVVTMGDGGIGIGGAHLLSACRRNLNLTLLILNNFNFGMTGGQSSATTFSHAHTESGFLNRLEPPMDICQIAVSAGAPYVCRCSAYDKALPEKIEKAICFDGFALIDIWGICPGRYTKKNKLTSKMIEESISELTCYNGQIKKNIRKEYGSHYREMLVQAEMLVQVSDLNQQNATQKPVPPTASFETKFSHAEFQRHEVIILGSAGQGIITAGEILSLAGILAGLKVTQKNEYDITVLRGASITEMILSPYEITFTGTEYPSVIIALSQDGVNRRKALFNQSDHNTLIIHTPDVDLPMTCAKIHTLFLEKSIKKHDTAIAALFEMTKLNNQIITTEMIEASLNIKKVSA